MHGSSDKPQALPAGGGDDMATNRPVRCATSVRGRFPAQQ